MTDLSSQEALVVYRPTLDYAADEDILVLWQTLTPHSGCDPHSRLVPCGNNLIENGARGEDFGGVHPHKHLPPQLQKHT